LTADLGALVVGWTPPPAPNAPQLLGAYARLERLGLSHCDDLFRAYDGHPNLWDYMPYGPFASAAEYAHWAQHTALGDSPWFYAIRDRTTGRLGGVASYLNIVPAHGSLEIGHICLAPGLAGTRAGVEALMQMVIWAMQAGYRRVEWKCNTLNLPSRRAAQRLGFSFEGVFRSHMVIKGRNRDSAWFAITAADWPALSRAYTAWLAPENFDASGRQIARLSDLTRPICVATDPALAQ
jgi:RimJ/RimL family protein N-acetyltransferase